MKSNLITKIGLLFTLFASVAPGLAASEAPTLVRKLIYNNIRYIYSGPDRQNVLDVYAPATGAGHPIVIYIHGGGWLGGNKAALDFKPDYFVGNDYVLVSINYRLSPAYKHPAHVQDVASAIAWVYNNATRFGGDPERIAVTGHSAGAHLAALVATDSRYLAAKGLQLSVLKAVIPLDGGDFDLPARYDYLSDEGLLNFNLVFGSQFAVWTQASPISYVATPNIAPFLLIKAELRDDTQDEDFAQALVNNGHAAEVFTAEGKGHTDVNYDLGKPGAYGELDAMSEAVLDFLQLHL